MNSVDFVDTTLRDGHLSLWACGMRTEWMLPVIGAMDQAGFRAMEIMSTSIPKKMVRELKEDPWERVRLVASRAPRTPLRVIVGRYLTSFEITPASITDLWLERLVANGIREVRTSDCSNTVAVWERMIQAYRRAGLKIILNLVYSVSPVHTDEYYADLARAAAKMDIDRICFKDPGGLLTPERTRALVPVVLREAKNIPVEIHTHCTTGLGPLCLLEAIKLGIRIVNTGTPPLANGSAHASVFSLAENAIALGYRPNIDLEALKPVSEHFLRIAKREGLPIGAPAEYNEAQYRHQIPGGMISNLRHQLAQVGMESRLQEVLEETGRVRQELGYPIMVTPYSQFVGVQAAINVIVGERYKEITDQVIQYALGFWGEAEASGMDPQVRDRVLSSPRARELRSWQPPEPSLAEVRRQFGGAGISDDELLLRYFAGEQEVAAMHAAPRSPAGLDSRAPLLALIGALAKKTRLTEISIRKGDFAVRLGRGGAC